MDDEEEMLYGDSNASASHGKDEMGRFGGQGFSGGDGGSSKAEPSHWCLIIRESGVMEVCYVTSIYESVCSCTVFFISCVFMDRSTSCRTGGWCSW